MKFLAIKLSAVSFVILVFIQAVTAQTETQSFDSQQSAQDAGWVFNDAAQNPERGCEDCATDLGWKDSDFVGGSAGEAGGLVHRAGGLPVGYYADLSIGSLSLNTKIEASGKVILTNNNFDGGVRLAFFDQFQLVDDPVNFGATLGIAIFEPGGGVDPNFRWSSAGRANDGSGFASGGFVDGVFDDEPLDFSISYDPAQGDFGELVVILGDDEPAVHSLDQTQRENPATFTAFGLFTDSTYSSADSRNMEILIDDVTYTSLGTNITAGDFNSDGNIDLVDFMVLASNFNANGKEFADGDIDFNGTVNGADFQAFREVFNSQAQPAGTVAVPEPQMCLPAMLGFLCVLMMTLRHGRPST